jgi:tRNA A-37 threonylcarbamoyl transferase component Bud32
LSNIEPTPFGEKYTLVEHIATGGMAEVYRANYSGIEGFAKELVVKTLRDEFAARAEVVQMFLQEARVAATLTHGNVVHTYDLGEIGGEYFIAMELLKGEELVQVLRRSQQLGKPISMELGIGMIMQSCEGLHYVHSRTDDTGRNLGLVHRDINPTNVHVGYDGACKILDFGIAATRASAVAKKGQVAGKISYMAPEQLQGLQIDARADIFPLGVMLYELCLHRRLFRGNREEVARRVLEGDIPPPTFVEPSFPPALEAIIMKALEVDPADRYQNCDHMFRDLEAFLVEAGMSWTPRRLSAMMAELFGEGAPADVDYEDEYDDLEDDALDFDAFENLGQERDGDDAPAWARDLASGPSASAERRGKMTLGSLEALVASGKLDETGPNRAIPPARARPAPEPPAPSQVPTGRATPPPRRAGRSGRFPTAGHPTPSGGNRALRRSGTGRHAEVSSGPLAALAPDAGSSFGRGVLTEQSKKGGAAWGWIIGFVALIGLAYFAYTLFTAK